MNPKNAAAAYKQDTFENAPPLKIVRMLYAGAIRFLDRAVGCDAADTSSRFAYWVGRADAIVCELRIALKEPTGGDEALKQNLDELYRFVEERLCTAMTEHSEEPVAEARSVLATLLEAWDQLQVNQVSTQP
ncbi:MAG: flagellar export chaperone FliS [Planctomycetes bacterium]|jgi:flagellar protein FliS|nr:flagellar export chaperone FliS [Planctomycetota bacterium]MDP6520721.1 flagellar export chaperone FliS [Planctomycetota bacterium]